MKINTCLKVQFIFLLPVLKGNWYENKLENESEVTLHSSSAANNLVLIRVIKIYHQLMPRDVLLITCIVFKRTKGLNSKSFSYNGFVSEVF